MLINSKYFSMIIRSLTFKAVSGLLSVLFILLCTQLGAAEKPVQVKFRFQNTIEAFNYFASPIMGGAGGTTIEGAIDNDLLNADDFFPGDVELRPGDSPHVGLSMNSDGKVTATAAVPEGYYKFPYTICDLDDPNNCSSAIFFISIGLPPLVAVDDGPEGINTDSGGDVPSVFLNDLFYGEKIDITNFWLETLSTNLPPNSFTIRNNGVLELNKGIPLGSYFFKYKSYYLNFTSEATLTINVYERKIIANPDSSIGLIGHRGGETHSVIDNDTFDGRPANLQELGLFAIESNPMYLSLDIETGIVTLRPYSPYGWYSFDYILYEKENQINQMRSTMYVFSDTASLRAVDDYVYDLNGRSGGTTPSVLENDSFDGESISLDYVKLIPGASPAPTISMQDNGTVVVAPGTAAGTYTYEYTLREHVNYYLNMKTAKLYITVVPAEIKAEDDVSNGIHSLNGGITQSVLSNDQLNGLAIVPAEVKLFPGTAPLPSIIMNIDGSVTVLANTPPGTYTYDYTICELLNPSNCSSAKIQVNVFANLLEAFDDVALDVNGFQGETTRSVLVNDRLNGKEVHLEDLILKPGASPISNMLMNPDGTVTVAAGTSAGTYRYPYTICELANPSNCSSALIVLTVVPAIIQALDDQAFGISGSQGGLTQSVLANDLLNGKPVDPQAVVLKPGGSPVAGMLMNPDGTVTVAAGTQAATYAYSYVICSILNPNNCSSAVIRIHVEASKLQAVNDLSTPISGTLGGKTQSVLDNDQLNGLILNPAAVVLSPGTSPLQGIVMHEDGTVSVAAGSPAGNYIFPYTICDVLNPNNCSMARITIPVVQAVLTIAKTANLSIVERAGDVIQYTILVRNNGGLAFKDVKVTDDLFPNWSAEIPNLPIGKEEKYELEYTVTAQDVESGKVLNTARVEAHASDNSLYKAEASVTVQLPEKLMISLTKNADKAEVTAIGELINYTIQVGNTGNKTLYDIEVRDPLTGLNHAIKQLLPGEKAEVLTSYTMLSKDFEAATLVNEAAVTARDAQGKILSAKASFSVIVKTLPLLIPNVFTPNGDGINDRFEVQGLEAFDQVSLVIFNVWGNEVYRNDKYDNTWAGQGLQDGTYYYTLETRKGNQSEQYKSWVLIKKK